MAGEGSVSGQEAGAPRPCSRRITAAEAHPRSTRSGGGRREAHRRRCGRRGPSTRPSPASWASS
eukprot:2447901-Rhodomonas_salina.1